MLLALSLARGALAVVGDGEVVKLLRFSEGKYELSIGGTPLTVLDGGPKDTKGFFPLYLLHNVLTSRVAQSLAGNENGKELWDKTKDLPVEGWKSNGGALGAAYVRSAQLSVGALAKSEDISEEHEKVLRKQIDELKIAVPTYGQLSKLAAHLGLQRRFLADPRADHPADQTPYAQFTIESGDFRPRDPVKMTSRNPLIVTLRNALEHHKAVLESNISPVRSRTNNRVVIGKWTPDGASAKDSFEVPGLFAPTAKSGGEPRAHGSVSAPAKPPGAHGD